MDDPDFNCLTPLENLDALLFQYITPQEAITLQDLVNIPNPKLPPVPAPAAGDAGGSTAAGDENNGCKSPHEDDHNNNNNKKIKKIVHRDVERQRRQEMASLFTSLRTILPKEYTKGKRSMWEHVDGAVNYIKNMEDNIKQLKMKRDKLTISSNANDQLGILEKNTKLDVTPPEITVTPCSYGGVEIILCGGSTAEDGRIPLSRVLQVLLEEGVSVDSCVSSKVNGKIYYTLLTEEATDHMTSINLCGLLQQSLPQKLRLSKNSTDSRGL